MVYETFMETVENNLKERLGSEFTVALHTVPKNNGLLLNGLSIGKATDSTAPTIYLNSYYKAWQDGRNLDEILDEILRLYEKTRLPESIHLDEFSNREALDGNVVYRLINAPANESLLRETPHIIYPDLELALVFSLFAEDEHGGQMSCLIRNNLRDAWHLSTDALFEMARRNTMNRLPAVLRSMKEFLRDITNETMDENFDTDVIGSLFDETPAPEPLYVLSNTCGFNGACCMMYDGILKDFADRSGRDLILLPSSIHEVLITPDHEGLSYEDLCKTISRINQDEVPVEDRLSNHLYRYSRKYDRIAIAARSDQPLVTPPPIS